MTIFGRLQKRLQEDGFKKTWSAVRRKFLYRIRSCAFLAGETLEERFSEVYEKNVWGSKESASGEGSEARYTEPLRRWLIDTIASHRVSRIVDAPCGDFNWMSLVLPQVDVEYYGFDIVETLIRSNSERFEGPKISFAAANICQDPLPKCDLLVVRDFLFHLSYVDVNEFLSNIEKVDYRYLLTTTHVVGDFFKNIDIRSGDFRPIDLFAEPFNFSAGSVIGQVRDYPEGYSLQRLMVLIAKPDVPVKLGHPEGNGPA